MAIPDPYKQQKTASAVYGPSIPKPASVPAPPATDQPGAQAWINNPDSGQGGMDTYSKVQNERWQTANASKDYDLMKRLQSDSQRVGYTLNPYNPPAAPTQPTPTVPNTAAPSQFADWQAKQNQLMAQYESMMNAPFQYNMETDPRYQAFAQLTKARADAAAQDASKGALETMNDRGLLNSSLTTSQLGQIEHKYKQQAETEALAAVPQFYADARADYQDRLRNAAEMLRFAAGQAESADSRAYRDSRAARSDQVDDRNYDRGVLEADRAFDRNVLEGDRAFDRGVLEQDRAYDRGVLESDRSFDFNQRQYADQRSDVDFERQYREARDQIQDERDKRNFDEDVRRYGIDQALQRQVQLGNLAVSQGNLAVSQSNLGLSRERFNADQDFRERQFQFEQDQANRPKATEQTTIQDVSKYASGVAKYKDGKLLNPDQVEAAILSFDLPSEDDYRKLYATHGLKWGG